MMRWQCGYVLGTGRGLGCELMLHLTRTLLQKSAALPALSPPPASPSPTQCKLDQEMDPLEDFFHFFCFLMSAQLTELTLTRGLQALQCWRTCRGTALPLPAQCPAAGGMCAESPAASWAGAGHSQVSSSQGRSCSRRFSGANRDGVVRLGSGYRDVLGGKHRFPSLPAFTRESDVPGMGLLMYNSLLELMHLLGSLILQRGGTQSMGSVTPHAGGVGATEVMEKEKQDRVAAKFSLATRGWPKVALTLTSIIFRG